MSPKIVMAVFILILIAISIGFFLEDVDEVFQFVFAAENGNASLLDLFKLLLAPLVLKWIVA